MLPEQEFIDDAVNECTSALLGLEGGPRVGIDDSGGEVHIRNTEELEDYLDGFVRRICRVPLQLMEVSKIRATLSSAVLASNSLQSQEGESSFFSGTFQVATDIRRTPTMTDRFYTQVTARPVKEFVTVIQEFQPCRVTQLNIDAFLTVLRQVTYNVALTRTTRLLVEAKRSDDTRRVSRHAKALYHLIAEGLPKGT